MTTCQSELRNKHKQFKCLPPIKYSYNFRYFSINFYCLLIPQLHPSLQKPNYSFLKFEKYNFLGMNFIEQRIFHSIKRLYIFKCFVKHPKKYISWFVRAFHFCNSLINQTALLLLIKTVTIYFFKVNYRTFYVLKLFLMMWH